MASDQLFAFQENAYDEDSYKRPRDGRRGRRYPDNESSKHEKYNSSGYHHYTSEDTRWTFPNSEISDPVYICDESIESDFVPLPRIPSECNLNADARIEEHFIGVRSRDEVWLQPYITSVTRLTTSVSITTVLVRTVGPPGKLPQLAYFPISTDLIASIIAEIILPELIATDLQVISGSNQNPSAAAAVKPDDFALYYKFDSDSQVRSTIPLFLVHRNTRNEVFHFPLKRIDEGGTKWWYVQIGNNKMQSFRQLSDLVRCYHLYRFTDARSGRMEVFPLWKGGVIDDFE